MKKENFNYLNEQFARMQATMQRGDFNTLRNEISTLKQRVDQVEENETFSAQNFQSDCKKTIDGLI